jgi:hypothetical protein
VHGTYNSLHIVRDLKRVPNRNKFKHFYESVQNFDQVLDNISFINSHNESILFPLSTSLPKSMI